MPARHAKQQLSIADQRGVEAPAGDQEGDPTLPQNLETVLFAYIDELAARREHKAGGKTGAPA